MRENPALHFDRILAIQSELDQLLGQTQSALSQLCPAPDTSRSTRINDQLLKQFKFFRVHGLHQRIAKEFLTSLMSTLAACAHLMTRYLPHIRTPGAQRDPPAALHGLYKRGVPPQTTLSIERIEATMRWLKGTEFELVQFHWPYWTREIDASLEELCVVIDRVHEEERMSLGEPQDFSWAYLLSPIFKLSRLFFKKLDSIRVTNMKPLLPFTELRSDQLGYLAELAEHVDGDIDCFFELVPHANGSRRPDGPRVREIAQRLAGRFEPAVLCMLLYFLPHRPDTDRFHAQSHLRA
ncbi:hypothetical protein PtA15_8A715 [Puccinia triticina]|uniref:Uncharacterized protein n=1 Tax=Puccinia triticina TaxID=208348 RepID=A0ABY7CTX7_9BASI|nr:uncharacterized protein PtA15_8A715 [Puccinia triticina]WAQ87808.1 hypothetical protein PtA15_8A715 [Puccinia triticina]WAR57683.1 hypothetical protein PtB15_8B736 [Puccinia triticina]